MNHIKMIQLSMSVSVLAHEGDVRPTLGAEYLFLDGNNDRKGHHIIVTPAGETYYNQAILYNCPRLADKGAYQGWADFYNWELTSNGGHGYQKYIDEAVRLTPLGTVRQRLETAIRNEKESQPAPFSAVSCVELGHTGKDGNLVGDKEYLDHFTMKALREYIAYCEDIPVEDVAKGGWTWNYFVTAEIEGARDRMQYALRHGDREWDWMEDGWINVRQYADVDVQQSDLI